MQQSAARADHGESLFHLDAVWEDHRGGTLSLADLRGHPVVLVMFYGNCTTACPILSGHRTLDMAAGGPAIGTKEMAGAIAHRLTDPVKL